MAYEMAQGVLEQYPIIKKIEIRLVHFSKGLEGKDESEDNHEVNLVLQPLRIPVGSCCPTSARGSPMEDCRRLVHPVRNTWRQGAST